MGCGSGLRLQRVAAVGAAVVAAFAARLRVWFAAMGCGYGLRLWVVVAARLQVVRYEMNFKLYTIWKRIIRI